MIRGLRYNITFSEDYDERQTYHFEFETWSYGARGSVQHTGLLSFDLSERGFPDPRISNYLSAVKILKRQVAAEDVDGAGVLKAAAELVRVIDQHIYADGFAILDAAGLISDAGYYFIPAARNSNVPDTATGYGQDGSISF